ncbi:MAG: O-antigen ligase family protein [Bacilli bacterium]|nr:O-antigen ligase family protein [Bacilli bacterium]
MNKINDFLLKNINIIIIIFLFLGPLFDLLSSLFINVFKIEFNFIILFKISFMFLSIYYLFFISKTKYKKISIFYILLILLYSLIYIVITIYTKDISVLLYEIQNLIRNLFFPICLISLINIYEEKKFEINYKDLSKILIIYLILIFIPMITKTSFNSYAYSKVGSIGWFNSTNEIGGILSILLPFLLLYIFTFKKKIYKFISLIVILFIYFSLGSKVPVLSIMIITSIYLIIYIYKIINSKSYQKLLYIIVALIIGLVLSFVIIPKTSFYKNIVIHLEFLEVNQLTDLFTIEKIDHFVFSSRIKFLQETRDNYINASNIEKLFGIGYIEQYGTDNANIKTIEMDYYDIFYRNGIIGFILIFAPVIYLIKNYYKKISIIKFDSIKKNIMISLLLIFILSLFSGHILTAPSVSIYAIIVMLYFNQEVLCKQDSL